MEEDNNTTSDHIIQHILNMAAIKHLQAVETMYQDVLVLFLQMWGYRFMRWHDGLRTAQLEGTNIQSCLFLGNTTRRLYQEAQDMETQAGCQSEAFRLNRILPTVIQLQALHLQSHMTGTGLFLHMDHQFNWSPLVMVLMSSIHSDAVPFCRVTPYLENIVSMLNYTRQQIEFHESNSIAHFLSVRSNRPDLLTDLDHL